MIDFVADRVLLNAIAVAPRVVVHAGKANAGLSGCREILQDLRCPAELMRDCGMMLPGKAVRVEVEPVVTVVSGS